MKTEYPRSLRFALILFTIILIIFAIIQAKDFLFPITLGILIAYLLYPLTNFLEKKSIPRIIAILISIILTFLILTVIFIFFYKRFVVMLHDMPALKANAVANIEALQTYIEHKLNIKDNTIERLLKTRVASLFDQDNNIFNILFTTTAGTIFRLFIMPVYVFLFLFYRTKFAYFILMITPPERKQTTINIMRDISQVAAKYMGGVLTVVLILCVINSTGLLIIGVKYAFILGILAALFGFIPNFGTLIGSIIPITFTLLTDSPAVTLKVLIMFIIVHFLENNLITPNIVGYNIRINPFFIILGLIVAALIWGIAGMLIVVPILATLKIFAKHIPKLQPYSFLLGLRGARRHALSGTNIKKFFKRFKKKKKDNNKI
ncbi:MAG: AI-2E family transporter [Bacteroidales bacterium]|nr:AI-2E family transporter [Bacteroidales bacterium]